MSLTLTLPLYVPVRPMDKKGLIKDKDALEEFTCKLTDVNTRLQSKIT